MQQNKNKFSSSFKFYILFRNNQRALKFCNRGVSLEHFGEPAVEKQSSNLMSKL